MSEKKYALLSVVVPVFNERNTVNEVVRRIRSAELPPDLDLEIVVVDDGSHDGTGAVLRNIEDSTVRVVRHETNKGQGAAIRTALQYVRGDVVVVQDADLEYDPSDISQMIKPIIDGRAEVVLGNRFHRARPVMPLTTLLLDQAVSIATCVLFNTSLADVETGYRAFDGEHLRSLTLESDGFGYGPELTAKSLRMDARIVEVPVSYTGRRIGRKSGPTDRLRAVGTLAKHRLRRAV
jgi:glycosyltransferase involved in cell wall biosynthesis